MLKRWTLENFKPIRGRLDLPLAPLTVLAGLNSSGKSSFLQSILLVAQTLQNQRHEEPLVLNGLLVRLGTFQDVCNERASERKIRLGFTLLDSDLAEAPTSSASDSSGWQIDFDGRFEPFSSADDESGGLTATRALIEHLNLAVHSAPDHANQSTVLTSLSVKRSGGGEVEFLVKGADETLKNLLRQRTRSYFAEISDVPEVSPREVAIARWAHFLPDVYFIRAGSEPRHDKSVPLLLEAQTRVQQTFTSAIRYLGPLRAEPHEAHSFSPSGQPDDVGSHGEYAAAVYSAHRSQFVRFFDPFQRTVQIAPLEDALDLWLRYLGVADHVSTREAAHLGVSWMVRSAPENTERPLDAVGVGVSQILPILVAGLLSPIGAILVMEQPELHLHERPQARLAEFFYGLTRVGKQVFIETHSAVLIGQLRYLMVKGGQEARDAMAIYFVTQDEQGDAKFEPIRISKRGAVENWPDGFFDESYRQEDLITEEGMRAGGGTRGNA